MKQRLSYKDAHHQEAIVLRETQLRLHALVVGRECPFFDDKEKAVLEFSEALTLAREREVNDGLFEKLSALFSPGEIIKSACFN